MKSKRSTKNSRKSAKKGVPADIGGAIRGAAIFIGASPARTDQNGNPANLVDGLFHIGDAIHTLARALREPRATDHAQTSLPLQTPDAGH